MSMTSSLRYAATLAACLALSTPAAAGDAGIPMHERFVQALRQQRFVDAAAMFKPRETHAPAATAAQLARIATRIGGFPTMRNIPSLPNGTTLKLEVPSSAAPAPRPNPYRQAIYSATAADGQPVFYIVTFDSGMAPQPVLWFEVQFPTPDTVSRQRAERALRDTL